MYPREREQTADGGHFETAEESPPTAQVHSRTQVRVARVTALEQKRHVLSRAMKQRLKLLSAEVEGSMERRISVGASWNRVATGA